MGSIAMMVNHLDSWGSTKKKVEQKYPLDDAILAYIFTNGYRFEPSKWTKVAEIPFDFTQRKVSIVLETDLNVKHKSNHTLNRILINKGALEEVLRVCSFIEHFDRGEIATFSEEDHQRILSMGEELSDDGLRVLGVAIKRLEMVRLILLVSPFYFFAFSSFSAHTFPFHEF